MCLTVVCCESVFIFFFFKQKTAYEMRISDWSSDVCSSDLSTVAAVITQNRVIPIPTSTGTLSQDGRRQAAAFDMDAIGLIGSAQPDPGIGEGIEIGRASCRERGCQYV